MQFNRKLCPPQFVHFQDVFLIIRREKTTIFLDATEETTVAQLKKTLQGIVKKAPEEQRLYNTANKEELEDNKTLGDCGYKSHTAKAQDPGSIGLAFRISTYYYSRFLYMCCMQFPLT